MKTFKKITFILVTFSLFVSCATVNVHSDYDSKTDFTKFKTFAFYKKGIDKTKISDIDKRRILRAIETDLLAKGMKLSKNPDVLVSIFAKSKKEIDVYSNNYWYPRYYGANFGTHISKYTEGTLFIDIISANDKKLLWQGVGKGSLNTSKNVIKKEERINEFVGEIMTKYPPTLSK